MQYGLSRTNECFPPNTVQRGSKVARTIAVDLNLIAEVLDDNANHPRWVPSLTESRRLGTVAILERRVYNRFTLPWPLSNRDFVYRVKAISDRERKTMICIMCPDAGFSMPKPYGVVRGTLVKGVFRLTEVAPNKTLVELIYAVQPNGWIPAWLAKVFQYPWSCLVLRRLALEVASRQ